MNTALPLVVATTSLAAVNADRRTQDTKFDPQQDLLARIVRAVGAQPHDCGQVKQPGN
jgi:hypothetical protein